MGEWSGLRKISNRSTHCSAPSISGCNFFSDNRVGVRAKGHSEQPAGKKFWAPRNRGKDSLHRDQKFRRKNREWPSRREFKLDDCYPPEIHRGVHRQKPREHRRSDARPWIQAAHPGEDAWLADDRLTQALKKIVTNRKKWRAVGISINRWEPNNGVKAVRSGLFDAVQVIYNIFDQNPEDRIIPSVPRIKDVCGPSRVFRSMRGTLTGTLTLDSKWPAGRLGANNLFSCQKI